MEELVKENEWGAYLGVTEKFLERFQLIENNKNFEVYQKNGIRLILAKCSRLADEGIDFHRKLPTREEAFNYFKALPQALNNTRYTRNLAFAAKSEEEYRRKARAWNEFYSYIYGFSKKIIWVVPHSGNIEREPDKIIPQPKLEIDSYTAKIAALISIKDEGKPQSRGMISIHSNGFFGAVIDLGDFGIIDQRKLGLIAKNLEEKYREKVQVIAPEYRENIFQRAIQKIQNIKVSKGTLHPKKLISSEDKFYLDKVGEWLERYGSRIESYEFSEFKEKIFKVLNQIEISPISVNRVFPGRKVGKLLELEKKIKAGLLDWAIQIEGLKFYLEKEPELVAEMILEIEKKLE